MSDDGQGISFDKHGEGGSPPGPGPGPGAQGYGPPAYGPPAYGPPAYGPPAYGPPGYGPPAYPPAGFAPGYGPRYAAGPPHAKPPSNIGWAIAAIFTFWPLAIPAFIAANRVDTAWFSGDAFGAQKSSEDARRYGLIGVIIGVVLWVLVIVWIIIVFAFVANTVHHIQVPSFSPLPQPS